MFGSLGTHYWLHSSQRTLRRHRNALQTSLCIRLDPCILLPTLFEFVTRPLLFYCCCVLTGRNPASPKPPLSKSSQTRNFDGGCGPSSCMNPESNLKGTPKARCAIVPVVLKNLCISTSCTNLPRSSLGAPRNCGAVVLECES